MWKSGMAQQECWPVKPKRRKNVENGLAGALALKRRCHAPNPKGSKACEIHPNGTCRFFLFSKSNYRRSLFSFLFQRLRIYNHTKISTLKVKTL